MTIPMFYLLKHIRGGERTRHLVSGKYTQNGTKPKSFILNQKPEESERTTPAFSSSLRKDDLFTCTMAPTL